jgi:peptide/nickel transport system ATP-binding protein
VSAGPLLEVRDLSIESRMEGRTRTIVEGVALAVSPGETIGIVGESGSGKSLTARAIVGLLPEGVSAHGEVLYHERNLLTLPERRLAELRGTHLCLVLQDPFTMLNPLRRCGRHIDELLRDEAGRRLSRSERRAQAVRRLAEVGIDDPDVVDRYPFQLSGGMRQRVGLAAALARDPELLIADEPATALDVTTQSEILALLRSLEERRGMALILITHDLRVAFSNCDRVYVLYAGSLLEVAPAAQMERLPLHPYTLALLLSEPAIDQRLAELTAIPGSVPEHGEVVDRCAFSPRCEWAARACTQGAPPLVPVGQGRLSACVRLGEISDELQRRRNAGEISEELQRSRNGGEPEPAPSAPVVADPIVSVRSVVKRFGPVTALKGVTVEVGDGESVGIVGESGSGKSTLARCLLGLAMPDEGTIEIAGIQAADYGALPPDERRRLRRTVQMVFQDPYSSLNPALSIGSTLKEALWVAGRRRDGVAGLLERVGLPRAYARRKPASLSGGERQRVAIARALAVEPRVLVCDEPVSALDVSVQAQILNLFARLRRELGLSYVFITHDLAVVRQVADRVYVLYRGEVVESGSVDDVLARPRHPYTVRLIESVPRTDPAELHSVPEGVLTGEVR